MTSGHGEDSSTVMVGLLSVSPRSRMCLIVHKALIAP